MQATLEREDMAKSKAEKKPLKSEVRRHTAMMRVDAETLERAKKAAGMMGKSLADYASEVLLNAADRDILREAKKLVSAPKRTSKGEGE